MMTYTSKGLELLYKIKNLAQLGSPLDQLRFICKEQHWCGWLS